MLKKEYKVKGERKEERVWITKRKKNQKEYDERKNMK